jgi:hypothetical protein
MEDSRDSVVGIATGYGLDDRGVEVRVPVGVRIFSSPCRPDWLWNYVVFYEEVWGSGGIAPPFWTTALDGGDWPVSRPGRFIFRGKISWYPLDRKRCGPQSRSGSCGD